MTIQGFANLRLCCSGIVAPGAGVENTLAFHPPVAEVQSMSVATAVYGFYGKVTVRDDYLLLSDTNRSQPPSSSPGLAAPGEKLPVFGDHPEAGLIGNDPAISIPSIAAAAGRIGCGAVALHDNAIRKRSVFAKIGTGEDDAFLVSRVNSYTAGSRAGTATGLNVIRVHTGHPFPDGLCVYGISTPAVTASGFYPSGMWLRSLLPPDGSGRNIGNALPGSALRAMRRSLVSPTGTVSRVGRPTWRRAPPPAFCPHASFMP